ncbi:hypothetical protein KY495_15875 [Massilia sp. PAMC28688]|uniref:DUF5691 domain-containing protein n=1 Tax=Massilia sp. PAMC28688 TaxID=2861283 RepID=UPI001C62C81E|nr:DUF5691 domain-containing protein [Massilia sp. PAMC28688]QYF92231.1 hypothetical protein KY495_15875 [Massilia sp. PAMC28688]
MSFEIDLHKAILAGTERVPLAGHVSAPALQALLEPLQRDNRLWHVVAAVRLWQRAGLQPHTGVATRQPAAPETPCPRAAEHQLHLILRGIRPELLENWLALAHRHAVPLPHSALPAVLDHGVRTSALRPAISAVLGARGAWLTAQHPQWRDAYAPATCTHQALEREWELGTLARRTDALRQLRLRDAAAGLHLLEQGWPQEPPESRAALLPMLRHGLSQHDEAFLESALDDKRKEVRTVALALLASLPGSQLSQRCAARLGALFTLKPRLLGLAQPALEITLPEKADKAMKRDGAGSGSYHLLGEKAGWLADLMQSVPPEYWSRHWHMAPEQVLAIMAASDFRSALLHGLVNACANTFSAARDESRAWLTTLIGGVTRHDPGILPGAALMPAIHQLPLEQQEAIVRTWLDDCNDNRASMPNAILWAQTLGHALPPALSHAMLVAAQRVMRDNPQQSFAASGYFGTLARVLDASDPAYVRQGWPEDSWERWPQWRSPVDALIDTIEFRHTMQKSFLEKDDA